MESEPNPGANLFGSVLKFPLTAAQTLANDRAMGTAASKGLSELAAATIAFPGAISAHEHGVHGEKPGVPNDHGVHGDTRDLVDRARDAGGQGAQVERHHGLSRGREI